ncbi:MAG: carbohydrate kinase family protein [Catenulisporales bacterium]|nr:carbohydrate kinase family protein [Catenulisporales bacterium]
MKSFDLLVVGDANPDVLLNGAPAVPPYGQAETLVASGALALGGSAAIVAHGAARLGLSTALAAMVGRDAAGDFVLDALTAAGVDVTACVRHETLPTALTVCLTTGGAAADRAILTAPGCLPHFGPEHLPDVAARHLHAASYFLQPRLAAALPSLFRTARATGTTTSLDTNHDPAETWQLAAGLVEACDVLLPNESEARALNVRARLTVIKQGGKGATAHDGEKSLTARGPELAPVDTVGAGDSFDAGFLAGYLATGDLAHALALGCACGSLSTRAAGGTAAQPDLAEAAALAAQVEIR